jgi:hypothetical protein
MIGKKDFNFMIFCNILGFKLLKIIELSPTFLLSFQSNASKLKVLIIKYFSSELSNPSR